MHRFLNTAAMLSATVAVITPALVVSAQPRNSAQIKADMARAKADQARRMAEHKQKMGPSHRGLPPASSGSASPPRDFRGNTEGSTATSPGRDFRGNPINPKGSRSASPAPAVAFNPASAPPPADGLKSFVAAGRNASSMDQLLPFLPLAKQRSLNERQAEYDPKKAAADRLSWRQRKPDMTEESLTYLTNSPYANELNRLKAITRDILDVLRVKTEGNKATVTVSTTREGTSDGDTYPYGKADIELIGEGNTWKFSGYNDSPWIYQDRPFAPSSY